MPLYETSTFVLIAARSSFSMNVTRCLTKLVCQTYEIFFLIANADGLLDMRRDVQEIFRTTPTQKQVMMFSATLSQEIRPICKKFMRNPLEVYVDDEAKLTLHGLQQYCIKLGEEE